jgi:diacylglycerol kinase family enzyme
MSEFPDWQQPSDHPLIPPEEPERYLFVRNPESSRAHRTLKGMRQLHNAGYDVDEVLTDPKYVITENRIAAAVAERDALVAAGGDGTVNIALNAYFNLGLFSQYLLVKAAGNANDSARNLHGKASLEATIAKGRPAAAYALQTAIRFPGGSEQTIYACSYAGAGGAGQASHDLNSAKERLFHTLHEPIVAWRAIGKHPEFTLRPTDTSAEPVLVTDMTWAKGNTLGKYGNTGADIFKPEAHVFHSTERGMRPALRRMLHLKLGKLATTPASEPQQYTLETDDEADVIMYHDGEPLKVPHGSLLTFSVDPRPYWTKTTLAVPVLSH